MTASAAAGTSEPDRSEPDAGEPNTSEPEESGPGTAHHHGYLSNHHKDEYLRRLRRIEGQARGLQRMIEDEKYCIDILTQVSAMTSALQSVALGLLDDHLDHCVAEAMQSGGDEANEKLKEASKAIARLVRS